MLMRVFAAAWVVTALVWTATEVDSSPTWFTDQALPGDVRALTVSTWAALLSTFPGKRSCLTDVRVTLVPEVADGAARYLTDPPSIEIEIPTSPARFPESLAHELAHHLEAACHVEDSIGEEFMRAQGFASGVDWRGTEPWRERPSEHFAEAVVAEVLGVRLTHADVIEITPEAASIVSDWARTAEPTG